MSKLEELKEEIADDYGAIFSRIWNTAYSEGHDAGYGSATYMAYKQGLNDARDNISHCHICKWGRDSSVCKKCSRSYHDQFEPKTGITLADKMPYEKALKNVEAFIKDFSSCDGLDISDRELRDSLMAVINKIKKEG